MANVHVHSQPVLITGGTGFAGRHLIKELLSQGYTNLHTTHFGNHPLPEVCSNECVHVQKLDLTDPTAVAAYIAHLQPTHVYHLASFAAVGKSYDQAETILKNNILLQLHLLNAIREHATSARVLIIGSAEEYGRLPKHLLGQQITEDFPLNPVNPYAVTKVTQDLLAQAFYFSYQLQIVRARPFNHIGTGQTAEFVIPAFASQIVAIEKGQQSELRVGNLNSIRDFTDVSDMINAYILLMEKGEVGAVYNIGQGRGWKIGEVLDMLLTHSQQSISVQIDAARLRPSDIEYFVANNSKIKQLGWQPQVPLETTLDNILREWRTRI